MEIRTTETFAQSKIISGLWVTAIGFGMTKADFVFKLEIAGSVFYFHSSDFDSNREAFRFARAFKESDMGVISEYCGFEIQPHVKLPFGCHTVHPTYCGGQ